MDIINKPEPTSAENTQLLHEILQRLRAVEEGLAGLQLQVSSRANAHAAHKPRTAAQVRAETSKEW